MKGLSRAYGEFKSLRFTIFILSALAVMFLAGLLLPQKGLVGHAEFLEWKSNSPQLVTTLDFLQLTHVYDSYFFVVLWILFFIHLIVVIAGRIPVLWKRCRSIQFPATPEDVNRSTPSRVIEGATIEELATVLMKSRYTVYRSGYSLAAVRNRYSPMATILFHSSFIILLAGALIAHFTKFRAEADIGTGETFTGNYTKVYHLPRYGKVPETGFAVVGVKPRYHDRVTPVALDVEIATAAGVSKYGINNPFKVGTLSFVIKNIDVAPLIVIRDEQGKEIDSAYVKLKVLNGDQDSFQMAGHTFTARFMTDASGITENGIAGNANIPQVLKQISGQSDMSQGRELVDPAFIFTVVRNTDEKFVASGLLRPGDRLSFGQNTISCENLSYWVHFYAGSESGLWLVYGSFLLATVALVLRFLFYRREVSAIEKSGNIYLSGKGEYYTTLFADEFELIVKKTGRS